MKSSLIHKVMFRSILMLAGLGMTACNGDEVDDLDFQLGLVSDQKEYKVGEPVVFSIDGCPDYLIMWSGDYGHRYAYRNRTEAQLEALSLNYDLSLEWAGKRFRNAVKVYLSEDFDGVMEQVNIESATWTDMDGGLKVPLLNMDAAGYQHGKVENVNVDLTDYGNKPFFVALRYELPPLDLLLDENGVGAHPDVFFYPRLVQTIDGKTLERDNPKEDFGFGFCRIHTNDNETNNPTVTVVDDQKVTINGRKSSAQGTYVWAFSQRMTPSAVSPDEGVSIKNASFDLKNYTYIYNEPGEYTVTFVARNANAWGYKEQIKELKIKVVEPVQEEDDGTI